MADDVTFTAAADATPPAGTKAATDEITVAGAHLGSHAGIAKLAVSADGDGTHLPATATDGLLVNLGANNDVVVSGTVSVTEPVSVDDNGSSLTVDAPLATPVHTRISDGTDAVVVTAAGELNVLATAQPGVDVGDVTVNNGAGAAAVNIQDGGNAITVDGAVSVSALPDEGQQLMAASISVAIASDQSAVPVSGTVSVTEPVSVDDNGSSLTVDAPLATPVHTRISDGTDAVNVSAAGGLQVDGSGVTQPVSAVALPLPAGAATSALQLPDGHNVTVDNGVGAAAVNIQDGGNAITVDGTVIVTATDLDIRNLDVGQDDVRVGGMTASGSPITDQPVAIGGRASTALPTDVGADGDAVWSWMNRNGAIVVAAPPHVGLNSDPYNLLSETAQYSTTQTSTVLVAGGASEKIVVTKVQIQVGGTTAGTLQLYFGTGAYVRGTNRAIFDGEFAPSATLKPGVIDTGPFISGTNGDDLLVTDSAAINPLTITVWYYLVV